MSRYKDCAEEWRLTYVNKHYKVIQITICNKNVLTRLVANQSEKLQRTNRIVIWKAQGVLQ